MSDAGTLPSESLPAGVAEGWMRPVAERQLAILGRLAEAGLEIAVALEAQAKGGDEVVAGDIAMAYSRVARAVRQTIMLQSRLIEALHDRCAAAAGRRASARSSAARLLRGAIDEERGNDAERAERLAREAAERIEAEDFSALLARPFGEAVAQICRELGLSPDWLALAEACAEAEADFTGGEGGSPGKSADGGRPGRVEVQWLDSDSS